MRFITLSEQSIKNVQGLYGPPMPLYGPPPTPLEVYMPICMMASYVVGIIGFILLMISFVKKNSKLRKASIIILAICAIALIVMFTLKINLY